ncbi:hypothetical protein GGI43DRAFT_422993 [Trichoderma evansii]
MLSSSTSSAGATETPLMPVAVLSSPGRVPEQLSLNGVQTYYNAYQPQACVSNTNGGPCPSYCSLGSYCRYFYGGSSDMPIESHPSAEAPNTNYSQQEYGVGQPSSTDIARSHSQQPLILPGSSSFDIPGTYQQCLQPLVLTASQESNLFHQLQGTNLPHPVYTDNPNNIMGGGQYNPRDSRQIGINEYYDHAPRAISPTFTGFGEMLHGAIQAQDWLPAMYPIDEPRQHGRAEEPPHDHDISDDLEELGNTDFDVNENGSSPGVNVEPVPQAVKRERHRLASGPLSRRNLSSPSNVAEIKKVKACVRCRMQKMKCEPDSTDLLGDCVGCKTYSKTSKKTIHRMPCYRGKITDAVLFRSGGLQLTNRWRGTEMKDVADRVNPGNIRTISFTLGISKHPIIVNVTEFRPRDGDVLARFWTVPGGEHGVRKRKDLTPFCLADIHKTAAYYKEYIEKHAVEVLKRERAGGEMAPRTILETTYKAAIEYYEDLMNKPFLTLTEEKERDFLKMLFYFWFALRHSTGSSWICGDDLLEMKPEMRDESYPLFGKVSVPRMILAQFDSINTHLLHKYGKKVLSELEGFMSRGSTSMWYTVYLCLFILLREASWLSEDRYRHARNNYGSSIRYSIPEFVEQLQDGCNNLLHHWHYYNTDGWPGVISNPDRHRTSLAHLPSYQHALVMDAYEDPMVQRQLGVWKMYKENNGCVDNPTPKEIEGRSYQGRQSRYDWDHPYYWIAQMFEDHWEAHPTYQQEPVSPY